MVVTPLSPGYITVDYGTKTYLSRVDIYTQSNLGAYKLYTSDDGTNWTYVGEKAANVADSTYDASTGCRYSITIHQSCRYIKIVGMDSARSDYCCWIGEVIGFGQDGTKLTASSAAAMDVVQAAKNAIDGNYTSYVYIKKSFGNCTLQLDKAEEIGKVVIYPADIPTVLYVQASMNNSTWITIATIRVGETEAVEVALMNTFKYFRIVSSDERPYSIYEIEIYAAKEAAK